MRFIWLKQVNSKTSVKVENSKTRTFTFVKKRLEKLNNEKKHNQHIKDLETKMKVQEKK